MKKIILILCVLSLSICLFACGNKEEEIPGDVSSFTEDDFYFTYNGTKITIGVYEEEFIKILESYGFVETSRDEASSCMFGSTGGKDKTIYFDFGSVFTFPRAENVDNTVDEIYFSTDVFKVKDGITIGATKEKVLETFGEKYTEIGDTLVFNIKGEEKMNDVVPKISFYFEDNVVVAIDLCANLYHV